MQNRIIILFSIPLTILIIIVSSVGLFTSNFYSNESLSWQAQSIGQDMIDLFVIAPCLLIASMLANRNNRAAMSIWGGVVLYLTYTFVLYSFDVHFNKLFVLYCLCLGLSFYSFLYFLFVHSKISKPNIEYNVVTRWIGIYFILIAVLFYFLWLSEIVPANIQNTTPKSVADAGLFTNGVQVLDLAIVLPAIFIIGIGILKRKSFGFILAPVILTFFVLMDLTIGVLAVVMKIKGVESDLMLTMIMGALVLVSLSLLIWYLKNTKDIMIS